MSSTTTLAKLALTAGLGVTVLSGGYAIAGAETPANGGLGFELDNGEVDPQPEPLDDIVVAPVDPQPEPKPNADIDVVAAPDQTPDPDPGPGPNQGPGEIAAPDQDDSDPTPHDGPEGSSLPRTGSTSVLLAAFGAAVTALGVGCRRLSRRAAR